MVLSPRDIPFHGEHHLPTSLSPHQQNMAHSTAHFNLENHEMMVSSHGHTAKLGFGMGYVEPLSRTPSHASPLTGQQPLEVWTLRARQRGFPYTKFSRTPKSRKGHIREK